MADSTGLEALEAAAAESAKRVRDQVGHHQDEASARAPGERMADRLVVLEKEYQFLAAGIAEAAAKTRRKLRDESIAGWVTFAVAILALMMAAAR